MLNMLNLEGPTCPSVQVRHKGLKKVIFFATFFHLLCEGNPMIEYESMKGLLHFLQVKTYL
jgi:hypothetical protein